MSELPPLTMPRPPEPAASFRFPLVATLAPVVVSLALWLVTKSMFALVFAALGPVTALAGFVDSRVGARRTRRRELARFDSEVLAARSAILARHDLERATKSEATPDAATIAERRGADHARWAADPTSPVPVMIGLGAVASGLDLQRPGRTTSTDERVERALDELVAYAAVLPDSPVTVDARLGIGVFGPAALATAFARGLAIQMAWSLSPADHWRRSQHDDAEAEWFDELPHHPGGAVRPGYRFEFGTAGSTSPVVGIAVADTAASVPGSCRVVIALGERSVAIVRHPEPQSRQSVVTTFVSREQACAWAQDAARDATHHGLTEPSSALPTAASLTSLVGPVDSDGTPSLAARVALSARGPVVLDLVQHGPHAVVGGTTGSGKSELLIAWVVAMASAHPPTRVSFLLVDFKGGSAFGSLASLPHTVGTITDLDERGAARALASLRAELAHRERVLVSVGARSIDDTTELPRLVIVVDEFAAMLAEHPDLHSLFSDIAARGRSLGVHLILCTQRPAGVVRDAVLANADLRVSLRVNNSADSNAVVGTDAAAAIASENRGRAIVRLAGGEPTLVQFALAAESDVRDVAERWPGSPAPRRPWKEPLPPLIHPDPSRLAFGVLDLPHEQRWASAVWQPPDGHVLVLGAASSGKSAALRALATDGASWLPQHIDAAWDLLEQLHARLEPGMLLIDDLDSMLSRFGAEHRAVVVERLGRVLRDGGGRGIRVAIAAQRLTSDLQPLVGLVPSRLWLRHASRQDFVLAGGDGSRHDERLPPGGGYWGGERVQVAWHEPLRPPEARARESPVDPSRPLAIVSTRAARIEQQLARDNAVLDLASIVGDPGAVIAAHRGQRPVILADPEQWQSRWGALASLRSVADVLFHGCSAADYRALTRSRELPPPTTSDPDLCWRLEPDGTATRARLPLEASPDGSL